MPASKVSCPKCRAVLRPSKPLPVGKKVRCPKCANLFTVRPDDSDTLAAAKAGPAKAGPGNKGKTKPLPPAKKKIFDDEDEDGPATYSFANEESKDHDPDAEEKEDISVVPDLKVKDPRGPATATIMRSSNWLMRLSLIGCLTNVVLLLFLLIPQLLPVEDDDPAANKGGQTAAAKAEKEKKQKEKDAETLGLTRTSYVLLTFGLHGFAFAYYSVIVFGVFKMQTLESYRWSIAACILAFIPLAAGVPPLVAYLIADKPPEEYLIVPYAGNWLSVLAAGAVCLYVLRKKEVIAGFEYQSE
ncbi:MAG: hypothetical protein ACJ8FY_06780 [Gemmataceae bacterium]